MILQQTLTHREKVVGLIAVIFMIGLVMFGYNQTVIQPAQASVLHSEKIEEHYTERYKKLSEHFDAIRKNLNLVKSTAVKSKLRSIKECLLNAQQPVDPEKIPTAEEAYTACEQLFTDTETQINAFQGNVINIEDEVNKLEKNVKDYEDVVNQALDELKKKNDATLGTGGH